MTIRVLDTIVPFGDFPVVDGANLGGILRFRGPYDTTVTDYANGDVVTTGLSGLFAFWIVGDSTMANSNQPNLTQAAEDSGWEILTEESHFRGDASASSEYYHAGDTVHLTVDNSIRLCVAAGDFTAAQIQTNSTEWRNLTATGGGGGSGTVNTVSRFISGDGSSGSPLSTVPLGFRGGLPEANTAYDNRTVVDMDTLTAYVGGTVHHESSQSTGTWANAALPNLTITTERDRSDWPTPVLGQWLYSSYFNRFYVAAPSGNPLDPLHRWADDDIQDALDPATDVGHSARWIGRHDNDADAAAAIRTLDGNTDYYYYDRVNVRIRKLNNGSFVAAVSGGTTPQWFLLRGEEAVFDAREGLPPIPGDGSGDNRVGVTNDGLYFVDREEAASVEVDSWAAYTANGYEGVFHNDEDALAAGAEFYYNTARHIWRELYIDSSADIRWRDRSPPANWIGHFANRDEALDAAPALGVEAGEDFIAYTGAIVEEASTLSAPSGETTTRRWHFVAAHAEIRETDMERFMSRVDESSLEPGDELIVRSAVVRHIAPERASNLDLTNVTGEGSNELAWSNNYLYLRNRGGLPRFRRFEVDDTDAVGSTTGLATTLANFIGLFPTQLQINQHAIAPEENLIALTNSRLNQQGVYGFVYGDEDTSQTPTNTQIVDIITGSQLYTDNQAPRGLAMLTIPENSPTGFEAGLWIATTDEDNQGIYLYRRNGTTITQVREITLQNLPTTATEVYSLAFAIVEDTLLLYVAIPDDATDDSVGGTVYLVDPSTGTRIEDGDFITLLPDGANNVPAKGVAYGPNGHVYVSNDDADDVSVWQGYNRLPIGTILTTPYLVTQQQQDSITNSATIVLYQRNATLQPAPAVTWTDDGLVGTFSGWVEDINDATGTDPLQIAVATANRVAGTWSQTSFQVRFSSGTVFYPSFDDANDMTNGGSFYSPGLTWQRFRGENGELSSPIPVVTEEVDQFEWLYLGRMNLRVDGQGTSNTDNNPLLTINPPIRFADYREIRIVARNFELSGWTGYGDDDWDLIYEERISREHINLRPEVTDRDYRYSREQSMFIQTVVTNASHVRSGLGIKVGIGPSGGTSGTDVRMYANWIEGDTTGELAAIVLSERNAPWQWWAYDFYLR